MTNLSARDGSSPSAPAGAAPHPEEMRVSFELRAGGLWLHGAARMTPAGLAALGFAAAASAWGAAALLRAALSKPR